MRFVAKEKREVANTHSEDSAKRPIHAHAGCLARAIRPDEKAAGLSLSKADGDIDRDRVMLTSCVLVEADVVVPEVVGGVQSAISSLPDGDIFPVGHWMQVLSEKAPVDGEYVLGGHFVHL